MRRKRAQCPTADLRKDETIKGIRQYCFLFVHSRLISYELAATEFPTKCSGLNGGINDNIGNNNAVK